MIPEPTRETLTVTVCKEQNREDGEKVGVVESVKMIKNTFILLTIIYKVLFILENGRIIFSPCFNRNF